MPLDIRGFVVGRYRLSPDLVSREFTFARAGTRLFFRHHR